MHDDLLGGVAAALDGDATCGTGYALSGQGKEDRVSRRGRAGSWAADTAGGVKVDEALVLVLRDGYDSTVSRGEGTLSDGVLTEGEVGKVGR